MRSGFLAASTFALIASSAAAQVRPQPGAGDPHIQSVEYKADQVVLLEVAPGYQTTVELAPDEQIESIAVGDSAAWQVSADHSGDHLFIKPLQGGAGTNMTVVTSNRLYAFDLAPLPGPSASMAYTVRFRYAAQQAVVETGTATELGRYKTSGARALRPSAIDDDGIHTRIEWPPEASLPAIYAIDNEGRETLANGAMRDGVYIVDGVSQHLIFRIDKQIARADRVVPKKRN
jgi:type IV secretion system protein VirB9